MTAVPHRGRPLLTVALLAAVACTAPPPRREGGTATTSPELAEPLLGAALEQHRGEMESAREALLELQRALDAVRSRRDRSAAELLAEFARAYQGLHLDPLLRESWLRTRDPELVALYAELCFTRAELLLRIGDARVAREALDDLAVRFEGSERILVSYPGPERRTFGEAMQFIRAKRWGVK